MAVHRGIDRAPQGFTDAVARVSGAALRPEVVAQEMPAPQRIAPHAFALSGDVVVADAELGTGRFILLHDPAGHDAWSGTYRCVTFARADVEPEMAADPSLHQVGWSWLTEALEARGARFVEPSGSVTVVRTEGFGELANDGGDAQVEIRASWTPFGDLGGHAGAWSDLLCAIAGLPPLPEGVIPLQRARSRP